MVTDRHAGSGLIECKIAPRSGERMLADIEIGD